MQKEILFATTNPYKVERFQFYFNQLGLKVISLADLPDKIRVEEDGKTPEENAIKKAMTGYKTSGKPSFGVDYWLYIEGLSEAEQPGPHVRRIFVGDDGKRAEVNDEELLDYYIGKVKELGGRAKARWISSIALVTDPEKIFVGNNTRNAVFTSERSPKMTPGEPLNSIQIDPVTGKYYSEMSLEEWGRIQGDIEQDYIYFMKEHINEI
ncbi:MAG: non-canonical purine NTP pyrophosphatase [Candidatus Microgenomates bacterium]